MSFAVASELMTFSDIDGSPLQNGRIYFGVANGNPETAPLTVYWDAALTQPAAQPIVTSGGRAMRNGTAAPVYANSDYSQTVRNQRGQIVSYIASAQEPYSFLMTGVRLASEVSVSGGASMVGYNPAVAYASGLGQFLNYVFGRTAIEIAAGVTPTNYAYWAGDPLRYGGAGNWNGATGADDTPAFRILKTLANAGQKEFHLHGRRYRLSSIADSEQLLAIANQDGMTWFMNGAELVVDRTFTGAVQCGLFELTACKNCTFVGGIKLTCTQSQPSGQHTSRGPRFTQLLQGSHNFKCDSAYFTDFREGHHAIRNSTDPRSYISRNPDFGVIYAYRTGYPCAGSLSGHGARAVIYAEECGRACFWTGIEGFDFEVHSKNQEASVNCLITTDPCNDTGTLAGDGPRGGLRYYDRDSTFADNSLNHIDLQIQGSELYIGRLSNLDIKFYIENTSPSAWSGFAFGFSKVKSDATADTVDRGHTLENIRISGTVKGLSANQRSCATQRQGTWGATLDTFSLLTFERIKFDSTGQPNFILTSLKDICKIDGLVSTATVNVTASTTAGSRVDAYNNSVNAWAVTGGNFYNHDDTEVTVPYSASMTIDAATGKNFTITVSTGAAFSVAWTNFCRGDNKRLTIRNGFGVMGAATFTGAKTNWTAPANNFNRSLDLKHNGTELIQVGGTFADVSN